MFDPADLADQHDAQDSEAQDFAAEAAEWAAMDAWEKRIDLIDDLALKNGLSMREANALVQCKWGFPDDIPY